MSENVFTASVFWQAISTTSEVAGFVAPFLVLIGCILWFVRVRTSIAALALAAGILVGGARFVHFLPSDYIRTVVVGSRQPLETNGFLFFLYFDGQNFGYLLLGLTLVISHWNKTSKRTG